MENRIIELTKLLKDEKDKLSFTKQTYDNNLYNVKSIKKANRELNKEIKKYEDVITDLAIKLYDEKEKLNIEMIKNENIELKKKNKKLIICLTNLEFQ